MARHSPARHGATAKPESNLRRVLGYLVERMQSDLRLAIATLFCLAASGIIGSFAIYRFWIGDLLTGIVDSIIVISFLILGWLAWKPAWIDLISNLAATTASLAGVVAVIVLGLSPMWALGILVANFLMAELRVAIVVSVGLAGSVAIFYHDFADGVEQVTFIAISTMIGLFSLIFATRVDSQHGKLTYIAARDGLTGAFNRRTLDHDLQGLTSVRSEDWQPHCLALFDLDNFKALNDGFGHEAGDEILIKLVERVSTNTREKDRFYRYGGEEFVLLLPRTSLDGAQIALDNLRKVLATELVGPNGPVTASYGLAEHRPGETVAHWLGRADQALLEAKRAGKDRVMTAT
jgi:diguanylate cyclase (GGDEF)-like protein